MNLDFELYTPNQGIKRCIVNILVICYFKETRLNVKTVIMAQCSLHTSIWPKANAVANNSLVI